MVFWGTDHYHPKAESKKAKQLQISVGGREPKGRKS